jgi:cytosine/uracil/thiamine/allantoin permease
MSSIAIGSLSILAVITIWLLLKRGAHAIKNLSAILAVLIILVGIWIFYMIVKNFGFQTIIEAKPLSPSGDLLWNYATGIEVGIVSFVFRKKQLNVKDLYNSSSTSSYTFFRGWNPASIIALLCGFITYFYLLNPLTYDSRVPYQYLTATLPTMAIGAFVYWFITRFVIIPLGWGGYTQKKAKKVSH